MNGVTGHRTLASNSEPGHIYSPKNQISSSVWGIGASPVLQPSHRSSMNPRLPGPNTQAEILKGGVMCGSAVLQVEQTKIEGSRQVKSAAFGETLCAQIRYGRARKSARRIVQWFIRCWFSTAESDYAQISAEAFILSLADNFGWTSTWFSVRKRWLCVITCVKSKRSPKDLRSPRPQAGAKIPSSSRAE